MTMHAVGFLLDAAQDYERMALRRLDCTETADGRDLPPPYALARGVADLAIVARVRRVIALEALLRWGLS